MPTWGINFGRSRRRSLERTYWAGPPDHWGRIAAAGDLTGLDVPPPARHQLIPYAGIVRLRARVAKWADEQSGAELSWLPIPFRNH